jgi:hypothetical protein
MDNLFWIRDSDNDTWNDFVETKMDPVRSQADHPVDVQPHRLSFAAHLCLRPDVNGSSVWELVFAEEMQLLKHAILIGKYTHISSILMAVYIPAAGALIIGIAAVSTMRCI